MLIVFLASSCEDYLDINTDPNNPTKADVQLVLPQAIVASAFVANIYNSYGGHFGGFIANAGGFSGFGTLLTYGLQPVDYNAQWTLMYQDPLKDLNYVIVNTEGNDKLAYFNAAAKIMTAYNYLKLVDTFGDVPYEQALRGEEGIFAPEYTPGAEIYADLLVKLDGAIAQIDNAEFPLRLTKASDPLFGAIPNAAERAIADQMLDWQKFANTLKLKMLVRLSTTTNVQTQFDALDLTLGFLDDDALVDPGFDKNKPSPLWARWGRTAADALADASRIPTAFVFGFYNGQKISDSGRGEATFVNYPTTPVNQLGNEVGNPTIVAGQVTWASNEPGLTGIGVLKGPGMSHPMMLLAEARLLLAEAQMEGYLPGNYITTYYEGISASFAYLYKDENEVLTKPVAPLVAAYLSTNDDNRLVEIEAATTDAQRLEAIITQKYIAVNMLTSDEAYNEYRRTGYPVTIKGGLPQFDIASNKSSITNRPDNLPTRVMYPSTEQSYNAANYRDIDYRNELIFWDPN